MPRISHLRIQNFRNIGSAEVEPDPHLNIIVGPNGAGKSSFLESIGVLAHGRSFRTHKYRNLINDTESDFTVFGRVGEIGNIETPMGVQRFRSGDFRIKIEDRTISSAAQLANTLPLIIIDSHSFGLLEGSPKERRRFFDWLVFHVKHEFGESWKQVSRCIKQRNSLLRRDKITYKDVYPWDVEIAKHSRHIENQRTDCFRLLSEALTLLFSSLDDQSNTPEFDRKITIGYQNGWKGEDDFESQLEQQFDRDVAYGYTTLGPHKADLKIKFGKHSASEVLSRGQQKLLIAALYISEAKVFEQATKRNPVFAIDDLPSELDADNQLILANWLESFDTQVFVTGISPDFVQRLWPSLIEENKLKVFHVKHGHLSE